MLVSEAGTNRNPIRSDFAHPDNSESYIYNANPVQDLIQVIVGEGKTLRLNPNPDLPALHYMDIAACPDR